MAESGGFIFGGSTGETQGSAARRRRLAEIMMREGSSGEPIRSWTQGANRMAQGLLGGYEAGVAERDEKAAINNAFARAQDYQASQSLTGASAGAPAAQSPLTGSGSSTGAASPAATGPAAASDVAFFNSRGWTPVQSAAIVGAGIIPESSGRTNARNPRDGRDGSDSVGMVQWNGPRAIALQQFAAQRGTPWTDRATQLAFIDAELRGQVAGSNESRWGNQLAAAQDPRSAARAVISYLRPQGWTAQNPEGGHNWALRYGTARSLAGGQAMAPPAVMPGLTRQQIASIDAPAAVDNGVGRGIAPQEFQTAVADELPIVNQGQTTATTAGGPDDFQMTASMAPSQPTPAGDMLERAPQASQPIAGDDAVWAERQRLAAVEDAKQRGLPWAPDTYSAAPSPPIQAPVPAARPGILDAMRQEGPGDIMNMAQAAPTGTTTAPTEAPVPVPRPAALGAAVPMARPDSLPPGATPAGPAALPRQDIARALGLSESERLALLRDEQSLAPGEADRLRGQAPVEMLAPAAAAAPGQGLAGVGNRLRELIMGSAAPTRAAAQSSASGAVSPVAGAQPSPSGQDSARMAITRALFDPNLPPEYKAYLQQIIQPQAPTIVPEGARVIDRTGRELVGAQPKETDDIRNYRSYVQQETAAGRTPLSQFQWGQQRRQAGATNVNVGGGSDAQVFTAMDEGAKAARSAATGISSIHEARRAVEGGAILGAGADARLALQKIGASLGIADVSKITNTETFRSAIAPQVAAIMKATVGSTQISNADREFAEKAAGGSIALDQTSILRMLDIMERGSRVILDQHNQRLETVYPDATTHRRERSLFSVPVPGEYRPAAPPAVAAPPGASAPSAPLPRVRSVDEARRLPSGSRFIDPNGIERTVP